MFLRLFESKEFKRDLEFWKSKINGLTDSKIRAKGQKLLSQYINHARQIDTGHDVSYSRNVKPEKLRENVVSLQEFRIRIEKFVKDIDS